MPARAAVAAAESADFHWHLARADRERRRMGWRTEGAPQHWRWRACFLWSSARALRDIMQSQGLALSCT